MALANVRTAQAAIDAARRNDHRIFFVNLHDFGWQAVRLV